MSDHIAEVFARLQGLVADYNILRERHGYLRGRIKGCEIEIKTARAFIGPGATTTEGEQ